MNITIEIDKAEVETINGTSRAGNTYTLYKQKAYMHGAEKYPEPINIELDSPQQAYPIGFYQLEDSSIQTNNFGNLVLVPVLKPIQQPIKSELKKAS